MLKILCVNEASGSNLGDKAIFEGVRLILQHHGIINITQIQLSFLSKSSLSKSLKSQNIYMWLKSKKILYMFYLHVKLFFFNLQRYKYVTNEIKNCDIVIFGGGSLIIDNNYVFPINLFFISLICRLNKKKYCIAGVSTRKLSNKFSIFLLQCFIIKSEFVFVRDHKSIDLFVSQFGIIPKFIPDFALLVPQQQGTKNLTTLAINIMGLQSHGYFSCKNNYKKYILSIQRMIKKSNDYKITLFTTGESSDLNALNEIFSLFENNRKDDVNVCIPRDLDELLSIYRKNHIIFGTRLHSAILGLANGNKVICFCWDDKIEGFFKSFSFSKSLVYEDDDFFASLQNVCQSMNCFLKLYDNFIFKLKEIAFD